MKKLKKSLLKEYLPVKVFFDDLESVEELLSKPKNNIRIETERFEFCDTKELKQKYQGKTVANLKISSSNPYVDIEFNKMWARLYVGSDGNSEAGLYYKLDKIITSAQRAPSFFYSNSTIWAGIFICFIAKLLTTGTIGQILTIANCLFLVWMFWVLYIRLMKYSEITIKKRHDIKNFLTRNKDQLFVNLIVAALGIIGTVIAYKVGLLK